MNSLLTTRRAVGLLALIAAVAVAAAACNSSEDDPVEAGSATGTNSDADTVEDDDADGQEGAGQDRASAAGYPIDVETSSGVVTIEIAPTRIVSLSPTATEILFAIGAGDRVVAVDQFSDYPPEAPEGTLDGFAPDLESILAVEPDLVVASGLPDDVASGLGENGVPVIFQPAAASFDDTYDQVAQLGVATGQIDEASAVNAEIRREIDEVVAALPELETPIRVFHEIDDSFYTATSNSFIGQIYATMGFENIADPLDDGSGFPLVDGEAIIAADPTLIVYTDEVTYDADDIAARPGWDAVTAVAAGRIVEVDADIASRWGPRLVEFMHVIVGAVAGADA